MKKLLTVLSTISVLAVSGGSVIACGSNAYDQTDDDGNSILIDGLGNLDFKDGTTHIGDSITTEDILNEILSSNGDSTLRGKIVTRFVNLMSAGFLKNGASVGADDSTGDTGFNNDIATNPYLNYGLKDALTKAYNELESSVESDIKTERDGYDDDYGKKAASKYKDMLEEKFPGITDLDTLKEKYKAYKMLNDEDDNVNTRLLKILLNTNQLGVQWTDKSTLVTYLNDWYNSSDKTTWVKDNLNKAQQLLWSTDENHDYTANVISTDDTSKFTDTFDETKPVTELQKLIKYQAPTSISNLETNTNYAQKSFLSNSQRFFLDKYYQNEAPVAVSQVTIKFATDGSMDNGINFEEDFYKESTATTDDKKRVGVINGFLASDLNEGITNIINGTDANTATYVTNKSIASLMTLSDSTNFSQMQRNVVYNYINSPKAVTEAKTLSDVVAATTRDKADSSSMYTVLADGILAFIDSDGLEIIRIDGWDQLKDETRKANDGIIGVDVADDGTTTVNAETAKELGAFNEFSNMTGPEQIDAISTPSGSLYNRLNVAVTNPYLHYLVNQSLLKGTSKTVNYDIMESLQSYVKISQPESGGQFTYWTALMDYFQVIQGYKATTNDVFEEFFESYIQAGDNDTAKMLVSNVEGWIESIKIEEVNDNITSFIAAQETENKAIDDNTNAGYPKDKFTAFNGADLEALVDKWTPYTTDTPDPTDKTELKEAIKETNLKEIANTSSSTIINAINAANVGLNLSEDEVTITLSNNNTGATIAAKESSEKYTGSVDVIFTISDDNGDDNGENQSFSFQENLVENFFKGGWM